MEIIISYLLSFKFLLLIAIVVGSFIINRISKRYLDIKEAEMNIKRDSLIKDIKYSEDDILKHLDNIINECIDEYMLMNITAKDITYITNNEETKIREFVAQEVPKRISGTLISNLSFIYNKDFLGEYIGKRIYTLIVTRIVDNNTSEPMVNNIPTLTKGA